MYVVRFVRRDNKPCEEYYYHNVKAGRDHLALFIDDDSDLYKRIELINDDNNDVIEVINYG